ncbi:MarR family transcriptional regulator [Cohnella sp. LGH]|uniref:MarR family winged helix-turn-helix transcriptional regulator n=1 Tax=Cohnella sp. LGH TaxID=1619153 RepID=UPI001ADC323A|nr:MarR family transcriptional regulator [Cohnella sp. LGH]QTH43684.1 MarR family transcriptional regulator [Cohnella sp. LGH]
MTDSSIYDLQRSVGFMLGTAYRKASSLFQSRLKRFDITPEQWSILYQVDLADGLIQKEIAERAGKDRPTTTRILDHLERKELVARRTDNRDRRSFQVAITDKGRNLIRETLPIEIKSNEDVRSCMSEEEYETLMRLLIRIDHYTKDILERE